MKTKGIFFAALVSVYYGAVLYADDLAIRVTLEKRVTEIRSGDAAVRARAKLDLLRPEYAERLADLSNQLMQAIPAVECKEDAVLLGSLNLSDVRRQEVLRSKHSPDATKARLGDAAARARVVARFRQAGSLVELHSSANNLMYVNDREAIVELLRRMESKALLTDVNGNQVSVTLLMIQAYGRRHPQNELFAPRRYLMHANVSPDAFQGSFHQQYLRKIEEYFMERHGLRIRLDPPILLNTDESGEHPKTTKEEFRPSDRR